MTPLRKVSFKEKKLLDLWILSYQKGFCFFCCCNRKVK